MDKSRGKWPWSSLIQPGHPPPLPVIQPPLGCESRQNSRIEYNALPTATSIRVLRIFPLDQVTSEFDLFKPLRCSLAVVDLKSTPTYDALSYTWSDPLTCYESSESRYEASAWAGPAYDIVCDDKPVSVGTNLFTALISIRWTITCAHLKLSKPDFLRQPGQWIWIDALCIDQTNLEERNSQVQMMARIYRQASKTIVWLGGEDTFASIAITVLGEIGESISWKDTNASRELIRLLLSSDMEEKDVYRKLSIDYVTREKWLAVYAFLRRSWFRRSWVVQEIILAKSCVCYCGLLGVSLASLTRVLWTLREATWLRRIHDMAFHHVKELPSYSRDALPKYGHMHEAKLPVLFETDPGYANNAPLLFMGTMGHLLGINNPDLWELGNNPPRPLGISSMASAFRTSSASDPRDKIYAFLGISTDTNEDADKTRSDDLRVIPNYSKPVGQVYTEAARFMIRQRIGLDLLMHKEATVKSIVRGLPSWVPDYSVRFHIVLSGPWTASNAILASPITFETDHRIGVTGLKHASVHSIFDLDFHGSSLKNFPISTLWSFLSYLAEATRIRMPKATERLREYKAEFGVSLRNADFDDTKDEELQSRSEMLWRTLALDCDEDAHPAPAHISSAILSPLHESITDRCSQLLIAYAYHILPMEDCLRYLKTPTGHIRTVEELLEELQTEYVALQRILGGLGPNGSIATLPPKIRSFQTELAEMRGSIRGKEDFQLQAMCVVRDRVFEYKAEHEAFHKGADFNFRDAWTFRLGHHRLFITSNRLLGVGPLDARVGDELWILAGCSVPMMLRPLAGNRYTVVGHTYLHGIMHGEAVDGKGLEDLRDITLC